MIKIGELVLVLVLCFVGCGKAQPGHLAHEGHHTAAHPIHYGQFPNFNQARVEYDKRILRDQKFHFLAQMPVPQMSYDNIHDVTFLITKVGNYTAAHSIALDSYSHYRIQVMDFILKLKMHSLRLGDHEKDRMKVLVFDGVIFDTFNNAQKHLTAYHEGKIKIFTDYCKQLDHIHPVQRVHNAHLIATKMRRSLMGYVEKMKKMKGAIRSSLGMLYTIHIDGI